MLGGKPESIIPHFWALTSDNWGESGKGKKFCRRWRYDGWKMAGLCHPAPQFSLGHEKQYPISQIFKQLDRNQESVRRCSSSLSLHWDDLYIFWLAELLSTQYGKSVTEKITSIDDFEGIKILWVRYMGHSSWSIALVTKLRLRLSRAVSLIPELVIASDKIRLAAFIPNELFISSKISYWLIVILSIVRGERG